MNRNGSCICSEKLFKLKSFKHWCFMGNLEQDNNFFYIAQKNIDFDKNGPAHVYIYARVRDFL